MAPRPTRSASSDIMPSDVSSDQALALALQASLNESTGGASSSREAPPQKVLTRQEREDMELAQALQESERLEREKRRREQEVRIKSSLPIKRKIHPTIIFTMVEYSEFSIFLEGEMKFHVEFN